MLDNIAILAVSMSEACNDIPAGVFNVVSLIIRGIQIVVPILLIIWGMIDFAKAVVGGDEDKIKAGQKTFLKRLIAAVIVFLVVTITQLVVSLVAQIGATGTEGADNIWDNCIKRFINGADA